MGKKRKARVTAEQAFKKRFVERKLAPMLADATDGYVADLGYFAERDDETVMVALDREAMRGVPTAKQLMLPLVIEVNVSCDSKWAILKDVMAAVADAYE